LNRSEMGNGRRSEKLVYGILEQFLTSAGVRSHVTLFKHVGFEFTEIGFPRLDFCSDTRIPGAVPLTQEVAEAAIFTDSSSDLKPASERINPANVRVE